MASATISRLIRICIVEEIDNPLATGVAVQPATYSFYFVIVLLELFCVNCVQVFARLFFTSLALPWSREYQIYVVVQIARFQCLPFIAVQPDAIAGTALFDI